MPYRHLFMIGLIAAHALCSTAIAAPTFTFVKLKTLTGELFEPAQAWRMNNQGVAVGLDTPLTTFRSTAVRWVNDQAEALYVPPETVQSAATGIDDSGVIVGHVSSLSKGSQAARWSSPTELTILEPLNGSMDMLATGICRWGEDEIIIGLSGNKPVIWRNGVVSRLPTLGGDQADPRACNRHGLVVGYSETNDPWVQAATVWYRGKPHALLAPGGASKSGVAHSVSDANVIVGWTAGAIPSGVYGEAAAWSRDDVRYLGVLPDHQFSVAQGVNRSGVIVGESFHTVSGDRRAVLWRNTLIDQNTLLSDADVEEGWILITSTAINDRGDIAGLAMNWRTHDRRPYKLLRN